MAAGKKSPASALRFRPVIEWYVLPTMGHISLRDLTTRHINSLYVQLLTQGKPNRPTEPKKRRQINAPLPLAAATVQKTHVALSRALGHAMTLDWLDHNPAVKAVRPQTDSEDRTIAAPNPEDVKPPAHTSGKCRPRVALLPASGVLGRQSPRRSRRLALVGSDPTQGRVTLASVLSVRQTGSVLRERTKSKRGVRQVSLDRVTSTSCARPSRPNAAANIQLDGIPWDFTDETRPQCLPPAAPNCSGRVRERAGL